jgi:predicted aldo/keto reductase-like oxidoreductase
MEYRPLGDTGIETSVIGLGVEHLKKRSTDEITEVVKTAFDSGVNYFDLVWSFPHVIEGVAQGVKGKDDVHLAVHLGSSYRKDKYTRAKTVKKCEETFGETLERLEQDKVSVINLHYVKGMKRWEEVTKDGGVLDLAVRLRDEGLGEIIAISTHTLDVVRRAVDHPEISSVMYQVNMANHQLTGRDEVLSYCHDNGVGLVAMKPYAAGNLLKTGKKVKFPEHKTGGLKVEYRVPRSITDVKCIHYALNQPGVCCVVTGANGIEELESTLEYLTATDEERDYMSELSALVPL